MARSEGSIHHRRFIAAIGAAVLAIGLFGCAGAQASGSSASASSTAPSGQPSPTASSGAGGDVVDAGSEDTTDQMFYTDVDGAEFFVFQFDGATMMADSCETVSLMANEPLRDGAFYKVVADVTFLNGGVAGYVDYPEIKRLISCRETSPADAGLPSIDDGVYGLVLIGDYADGDILLHEYGKKAVWKEGSWVYRYDKDLKLSDGAQALVRNGVDEDAVRAGMANGVLSCEDYFVLPAKGAASA